MAYYLAPSLAALRSEVDARWPNRDKASDGWIGDPAHSARVSDHNPDWSSTPPGVVRALDIDIDGIDVRRLLTELVGDPRVWYVIYDRKIYSRTHDWAALAYTGGGQVTETEDLTNQDPRTIARAMLAQFGFGEDQFSCLDSLYMSESGWDVHADNPASSAYGIPQALPGSKMASAGRDWQNNPETQIRWGLQYIQGRYGTPCAALAFKESHNRY